MSTSPESKYAPCDDSEVMEGASAPPPLINPYQSNSPPPYSTPSYAPGPIMQQPAPLPGPRTIPEAIMMPTVQQNSQNINITNNTNIVGQMPRLWSTSIFDCCDDCGICCCGVFCGICQACQISSDMGESCCVPICVPNYLTVMRAKMRAQYNITGTVMKDNCLVCCCGPCVQCQIAREIKFLRQTGHLIFVRT